MAEIHKLKKNGQTILPATTSDAVVHPQVRSSLTDLVNEYNVSVLYPTEGVSGNKYTLSKAITVLGSKLSENQKTISTRVAYIDSTDSKGRVYRYLGSNVGSFTSTSSWSREDSWFVETGQVVNNIEATLVSTALRKTKQSLTESEKAQARENIGAVSMDELLALTSGVSTASDEPTSTYSLRRSPVRDLYEEVEVPDTEANYCVGEWNDNDLSPEAVKIYGDLEFLDKWDAYLIDCTQNTEETIKPIGKLMKNNYLRFEDGSFAPTIGITEEKRSECDVELFLDNTQTIKYCSAGEFNAEEFYNEFGMDQKLYNASGDEVNILRPWETTETKYTIVIGRIDKVYLLDNVLGNSGKRWKGLFSEPVIWDGIDVSNYALEPTGISPCPVTTIDGKTRNFFYLYSGEENCQSGKGIGDICSLFVNNRTYPRVNDMHQVTNMKWARNNNSNPLNSYPFAEGGFHALNTFLTSHEVQYKTKYLHNPSLFSAGISSNDGCNNENSWMNYGGIRWKVRDAETWSYDTWGSRPSDICYDDSGSRTNWSFLLNGYYPKEQCMESQMAASFATELGISEGVEFKFYGDTYWFRNPVGAKGLIEGKMNTRVYKKISTSIIAYNTSGEIKDFDVEVILRVGLMDGVNTCGDIYWYFGGGYEQVGTVINQRNAESGSAGTINNPIITYLEPNQTNWLYEESYCKENLGTFDFENIYEETWSGTNQDEGWAKSRESYTAFITAQGGSINAGECSFNSTRAKWADEINKRYRISARFRGQCIRTNCTPRSLNADYPATITWYTLGGSAQVLLGE